MSFTLSFAGSRRRAALAALAAIAAPPVLAQSVGGIGGDGLTFQQAQRKFPGLGRATFETADLNGDGVIEANELPVLQGIYAQTTQSR